MLKTTLARIGFGVSVLALMTLAALEVAGTTEAPTNLDRAVAARTHQRRTTDRFFERSGAAHPASTTTPRVPAPSEKHTHQHFASLT